LQILIAGQQLTELYVLLSEALKREAYRKKSKSKVTFSPTDLIVQK